jgi:hypothetical protein
LTARSNAAARSLTVVGLVVRAFFVGWPGGGLGLRKLFEISSAFLFPNVGGLGVGGLGVDGWLDAPILGVDTLGVDGVDGVDGVAGVAGLGDGLETFREVFGPSKSRSFLFPNVGGLGGLGVGGLGVDAPLLGVGGLGVDGWLDGLSSRSGWAAVD